MMISPENQTDPQVLGPDFWVTVKAVFPVVGLVMSVATAYLRQTIKNENNRQRKEMMEEIRNLFALKETIAEKFSAISEKLAGFEKRMDRIDEAFIRAGAPK